MFVPWWVIVLFIFLFFAALASREEDPRDFAEGIRLSLLGFGMILFIFLPGFLTPKLFPWYIALLLLPVWWISLLILYTIYQRIRDIPSNFRRLSRKAKEGFKRILNQTIPRSN
jgi:hypothetical protein